MNNLLLIGYVYGELPDTLKSIFDLKDTYVETFDSLSCINLLISYLIESSNYKLQKNETTQLIDRKLVDPFEDFENNNTYTILINPSLYLNADSNINLNFETLQLDKLIGLINFRFLHLNPIIEILDLNDSNSDLIIKSIYDKKEIVLNNFKTRLLRVKNWIGYNDSNFENLDTMINYINKEEINKEDLKLYFKLLSNEINYNSLLINIPLINKFNDDYYSNLINKWDFNAFNFNNDELIQIGFIIFKKFLILDNKSISENNFKSFLFLIRDNYRIGNPFHNFRHAIDVLQATNIFLNKIKENDKFQNNEFESFSLLLSSLGHDIGHPGITNLFLTNLKSPLFKIYENSILEKYHKFEFLNYLIPFLDNNKDIFSIEIEFNELKEIINNSILATDMAKHDEFVKNLKLEYKINENDFKLISCLLIKCADISNVCRYLNTSCKWGLVLGEEFLQISKLEKYLNNEEGNKKILLEDYNLKDQFNNKLIKDINLEESIKLVPGLSNNQLFFINRFANEFFESISISIPELKFLYDKLQENTIFWNKDSRKS